MSKAKFHVLRKDRDALPKEVKGIYSGDEFPEYKNANTLTIGGKTYIEGLDYEVISSGKHTKIEVCPACKKLSILYAKGMCKACAQRTLYRHTEAKPEKSSRNAQPATRSECRIPTEVACKHHLRVG